MRSRCPAAALLLVALALAAGCGSSSKKSSKTGTTKTTAGGPPQLSTAFGSMAHLPGVLTTPPPWGPNTAQLRGRLKAIGLPALGAEGQAIHIHQHLDIYDQGHHVTVPGLIGISVAQQFISPLHTHDTSGIMHVESPTQTSFSLGQFFAVWGVRLDAKCIGGLCAGGGKQLRAWVNGHPVPGDPTRIVLSSHQEIVIAYGTPAQLPHPIPSSYKFPSAL